MRIDQNLLSAAADLPYLSSTQAHTLSLIITSGYVGSIYLSNVFARADKAAVRNKRQNGLHAKEVRSDPKAATTSPALPPVSATDRDGDLYSTPDGDSDSPKSGDRDHPATIKRRVRAVCIATGLSLGGVWSVVRALSGKALLQVTPRTLALLGLSLSVPTNTLLQPASLIRAVLPYILAPTILLGPLYAMYFDGDLPLQGSSPDGLSGRLSRWANEFSWIQWRNYVYGPITEELCFRSSLIAIALLSHATPKQIVFGSPMWFGTAHAHHAWEMYRKSERDTAAVVRAVLGCVFQLSYTTLFGWFAAYTHIRTGSVLPAVVSHIYCNIMGIYLPTSAVARHPKRSTSIRLTYIAGIVGFVYGLRLI